MFNWGSNKFFSAIIIVITLFCVIKLFFLNNNSSNNIAAEKNYNIAELNWDAIVEKAKKENSVIVSTWWAEGFFLHVAKLFEEKYGIPVQIVVQSNDTTLQKIILEKKMPQGDIDIFIAGYAGHLQKAIREEIFMSGLKKLPEWDKLVTPDRSYQKNLYIEDFMVPIYRNQVGFLYNPNFVPDPPRSWEEFNIWIKENSGKFVFSVVKDGSGEAFKHSVVYHLTGGFEKYITGNLNLDMEKVKNWDIAWNWFNENKKYLGFSSSNHDSLNRLHMGDAWITPAFIDDTFIVMNNGLLDKKMKMYMPDFGLFRGGDAAGIVVNAPHKAAAMLFLSFITSKEIQILLRDTLGSDCIRNDIENPYNSFLASKEREKAIAHTDPVYYVYLASEFVTNVLEK